MKLLLDFILLVIFFVSYKIYDIFIATIILIFGTGILLVLNWFIYRKLEIMALIGFLFVSIFGALTVFFHNDEFIKWKVTAIYSFFSLALLCSHFFMRKSLIQNIAGKNFYLPTQVWRQLNIAWAIFFLICGMMNIYVAFFCSQEFWVIFKVFGLTGLSLIFVLLNFFYILYKKS